MPDQNSTGGQTESAAPSFETALAELERTAQAMEEGKLTLEESLAAYKRGMELLKFCQEQLADAEQKVQLLEGGALKDLKGQLPET